MPRSHYSEQRSHSQFLSHFGIEQVQDEEFRRELIEWLDGTLRPWFSDRILGISEDVVLIWRRMVEKGRKRGYTFDFDGDFFSSPLGSNESLSA